MLCLPEVAVRLRDLAEPDLGFQQGERGFQALLEQAEHPGQLGRLLADSRQVVPHDFPAAQGFQIRRQAVELLLEIRRTQRGQTARLRRGRIRLQVDRGGGQSFGADIQLGCQPRIVGHRHLGKQDELLLPARKIRHRDQDGLRLQRRLLQESFAHDLRVQELLAVSLHLVQRVGQRVGKIADGRTVGEPGEDQDGHRLLDPVVAGLQVGLDARQVAPASRQQQRAGVVERDVVEQFQRARDIELVALGATRLRETGVQGARRAGESTLLEQGQQSAQFAPPRPGFQIQGEVVDLAVSLVNAFGHGYLEQFIAHRVSGRIAQGAQPFFAGRLGHDRARQEAVRIRTESFESDPQRVVLAGPQLFRPQQSGGIALQVAEPGIPVVAESRPIWRHVLAVGPWIFHRHRQFPQVARHDLRIAEPRKGQHSRGDDQHRRRADQDGVAHRPGILRDGPQALARLGNRQFAGRGLRIQQVITKFQPGLAGTTECLPLGRILDRPGGDLAPAHDLREDGADGRQVVRPRGVLLVSIHEPRVGKYRRHACQWAGPLQEDIRWLQFPVRAARLRRPLLQRVQQALGERPQDIALGMQRPDQGLEGMFLPGHDGIGAFRAAPAGQDREDRAILLGPVLLAFGREQPALDRITPANVGGGRRMENLQREAPRPVVGGRRLVEAGERPEGVRTLDLVAAIFGHAGKPRAGVGLNLP